MSEIHTECLNEDARTLDCYIFDYFNHAEPDIIAALIKEWKKLQDRKRQSPTPEGEKEGE